MAVVAIVAVLATLMLPYYNSFIARARRGEARSNLRVISSLQKAYRLDYAVYGTLSDVGYCGGSAKCAATAAELENDLGFNPKKCPALRYCYSATTSTATATATDGKDGKWIYPRCNETDTLTLGVKAKKIVIPPGGDIIKKCDK